MEPTQPVFPSFPIHLFGLLHHAVKLVPLDRDRKPLDRVGTGFVLREDDGFYLHTCWHVVTGINPHAVTVPLGQPERRYLSVQFHRADARLHGRFTFEVPLYENASELVSLSNPLRQLYEQDDTHVPHVDLNGVGLFVPTYHDAVRIKIPTGAIDCPNAIRRDQILPIESGLVFPGEKCLLVGFPYGYITHGHVPLPVVLTRFVASESMPGRWNEYLLDSVAAAGMSGSPVFVERSGATALFGMYTGSVYPDGARLSSEKHNRVTDLGTLVDLSGAFYGRHAYSRRPKIECGHPPRPNAILLDCVWTERGWEGRAIHVSDPSPQ
jgi:hypothetical protein